VSTSLLSHWVAASGIALATAAGMLLGHDDDARPGRSVAQPGEEMAETRAPAPPPEAAASRLLLERLQRPGAEAPPVAPPGTDLFAGRSWQPPAPPPPRAAPPAPPPAPAPTAPTLPFVYVGTLAEEGQEPVYYLEHGTQVLALKAGAAIGGHYRLLGLRGSQLEFHYLPLDQRQTLRIRE
jgi:hypothetical protein